jgi:hypothetical protein
MTGVATSNFVNNLALFTKMAKSIQVRGDDDIKVFDH